MANIEKRGKTYRITVCNGYDITGKQVRKRMTYTPAPNMTEKQIEKAVKRVAFEFEQAVLSGNVRDGNRITLADFYIRWLKEYAEISLEPTTVEWYSKMFETKILPKLGHLKLSEIKPLDIQHFYNSLGKLGAKQNGGTYSPTSIKRFHSAISSILNKAVEWELIDSNPAKKTNLPKQKSISDSVHCFTPEQAIIFLNALNKEYTSTYSEHTATINDKQHTVSEYTQTRPIPTQFKVLFNIALYGGLRRGEIIALTWDDIDFNLNTITINKSVAIVNNVPTVKSTKTKSSERVLSLPENVMQLLEFWRKEQIELQLTLGDKWEGENNIFIQWNGKRMHPSTPYHTFMDIIDKYNSTVEDESLKLPRIRFHDLRHTSATLLISANMDIKTVSARLGHAQTSTTMNIYAHSYKKLDEVAAETLENMLNPKTNTKTN